MIDNSKFISMVFFGLVILLGSQPALADHANCNDVHAAAFLDEPGELTTLVHHGADLDCRDVLRQTPLITATDGASLDIIKILLEQGVTVNARDELGETALAKARHKLAFFDMKGGEGYRRLYEELIELLEQAGATE